MSFRLPLVDAPLDTMRAADAGLEMVAETSAVQSLTNVDLGEPGWLSARLSGLPAPKDLEYARYENSQYEYGLLYPDTLFQPVQILGEGHGMEFATSDSSSRILVYAIENAGRDDLESQYRAAVTDAEARVTYRARDESWYIVAGTHREHSFYEKAHLRNRVLRTFRINYPTEAGAYFDAVTAVIASDFN